MYPSIRENVTETVLGMLVVLVTLVPGAWGQADVQGQWSTLPYLMPTNAVHAALLYNGKVLVIAGSKMHGWDSKYGGGALGPAIRNHHYPVHELLHVLQRDGAACRWPYAHRGGPNSKQSYVPGKFAGCDLRSCHEYFYPYAKHGPWPLVSDVDHVERRPDHDFFRTQRDQWFHQYHGGNLHLGIGLEPPVHA